MKKYILFSIALVTILWFLNVSQAEAAQSLEISPNGRYLTDQNGIPFLIHGDSPWSIIVQLTKEEADEYLESRRQKGFNSIVVNLIEYEYATQPPYNVYGDVPFTTPGDFSTPNEAYFAHADWVIQKAAEKGIIVMLNPCYLGYGGPISGWWKEVENNGPTKSRNYGRYLGNRYKNYTNIVWVAGGDGTPIVGSDREKNWLEILLGIKDNAPDHLWTAHWAGEYSLYVAAFRPYMDLNGIYATDLNGISKYMLDQYNRADFKPTFLWESKYEGPNYLGNYTPRQNIRRQAYEANLCGSTGQNFGSTYIFGFGANVYGKTYDWRWGMEQQGSYDMVRVKQLFSNRGWHDLIPDQNHSVITAGYGTLGSADYVSVARAGDGSFAMAYIPSTGTGTRTLTVDMGKLSGNVTTQWYNPTSGAYSTISGSPFPNSGSRNFTTPGDNGTGTNDWVLVLDASGQVPSLTPVAHWKLDETSGTTASDSSGNGNTGTLVNGPVWASGKIGGGLNFDGADDYVNLGNPASLQLTGAMTITAWIYLNNVNATAHRIVSKLGVSGQRGWELVLDDDPDNNLLMRISSNGTTIIDAKQAVKFDGVGRWVFVAGTYVPGTSLNIYRDGVLVASNTASIPASQFNSNQNVNIGRGPVGYSPFNGKIDDVRIYNRALSAAEIQSLYQSQSDTTPPAAPQGLVVQ